MEDWDWGAIVANFGYVPSAMDEVAAAVARPSAQNIMAVERAYRSAGHSAPAPLMDWLWSRYYSDWGSIPRDYTGSLSTYMPLILIGGVVLLMMRR